MVEANRFPMILFLLDSLGNDQVFRPYNIGLHLRQHSTLALFYSYSIIFIV